MCFCTRLCPDFHRIRSCCCIGRRIQSAHSSHKWHNSVTEINNVCQLQPWKRAPDTHFLNQKRSRNVHRHMYFKGWLEQRNVGSNWTKLAKISQPIVVSKLMLIYMLSNSSLSYLMWLAVRLKIHLNIIKYIQVFLSCSLKQHGQSPCYFNLKSPLAVMVTDDNCDSLRISYRLLVCCYGCYC